MFCTFFTGFTDGAPHVLDGCGDAFERNKGDAQWSVAEQFAHELFGADMFTNKSYGTCTSAAVYLTTGLRSVGVPTRMVLCIPIADASDPAQVRMVENGIGVQNGGAVSQKLMEARLTETFGEEGKVNMENLIRQHNERLSEVSSKYREELAEQQQTYLLQIKDCRDEIQALKSALRHEQQKSRRLQALLRGDP